MFTVRIRASGKWFFAFLCWNFSFAALGLFVNMDGDVDAGFCFVGSIGLIYAIVWPVAALKMFRADSS